MCNLGEFVNLIVCQGKVKVFVKVINIFLLPNLLFKNVSSNISVTWEELQMGIEDTALIINGIVVIQYISESSS